MKDVIAAILGVIIILGIYALMAWALSEGTEFVFGIELGFWRTAVAIFVIGAWSRIIFSGTRTASSKGE
ncbi:hypothetical protein HYI36_20215 [Bacillus sp. Gen3]|nr:hypothetical protein [Bacillus sp. Gen3]